MHHPHDDALVITTKIANSFIHQMLIDSESCQHSLLECLSEFELKRADLCPMTSPLFGFTRESMISEGIIKLVVTLGETPQIVTTMIDFFMVNYMSAYNRVLGRPLLRALKAVTSIHCLTMKFSTIVGKGQV